MPAQHGRSFPQIQYLHEHHFASRLSEVVDRTAPSPYPRALCRWLIRRQSVITYVMQDVWFWLPIDRNLSEAHLSCYHNTQSREGQAITEGTWPHNLTTVVQMKLHSVHSHYVVPVPPNESETWSLSPWGDVSDWGCFKYDVGTEVDRLTYLPGYDHNDPVIWVQFQAGDSYYPLLPQKPDGSGSSPNFFPSKYRGVGGALLRGNNALRSWIPTCEFFSRQEYMEVWFHSPPTPLWFRP